MRVGAHRRPASSIVRSELIFTFSFSQKEVGAIWTVSLDVVSGQYARRFLN